ncbi:RraA family protein [Oricola sp.]|uniref:RraA family protein n=1 Tax=Oricola sp. TaxID=1979950 RepID=UPI003515CAB3
MTFGFRIFNDHARAREDLVAAAGALPTAILSDNLSRIYAAGPAIRPMHGDGVLCGTALTVKTRPGDNLMIHKAVDMAEPGDVIVVEAGGDLTNSLIGELIITHAVSRGVKGFVIDGAVRDLDAIRGGTTPIFAAGVSHRGPYKDGPGEVNVPIALHGMIVSPGDIIVGDLDGVLCVPTDDAEAIIELALAQVDREKKTLEAIAGEGWDRGWVDEILRTRGCSLD